MVLVQHAALQRRSFLLAEMGVEEGVKKPVPQELTFKYTDVKYTRYNLKFN